MRRMALLIATIISGIIVSSALVDIGDGIDRAVQAETTDGITRKDANRAKRLSEEGPHNNGRYEIDGKDPFYHFYKGGSKDWGKGFDWNLQEPPTPPPSTPPDWHSDEIKFVVSDKVAHDAGSVDDGERSTKHSKDSKTRKNKNGKPRKGKKKPAKKRRRNNMAAEKKSNNEHRRVKRWISQSRTKRGRRPGNFLPIIRRPAAVRPALAHNPQISNTGRNRGPPRPAWGNVPTWNSDPVQPALIGSHRFIESGFCICRIYGDPHYQTYDNVLLRFQGRCRYTVSKYVNPGDDCQFDVEISNERDSFRGFASYVKTVYVMIGGKVIKMMKHKIIEVDGRRVAIPTTIPGGIDIRHNGFSVEVHSSVCQLTVSFDGNKDAKVAVWRPKYSAQTTGMCGNCDGNKRNDFRTKDGLNVWGLRNAVSLVGNSFVVADDRGNLPPICKVPPPTLPPCDPSKKQLFSSRDYCGIITDQSGPFGQCISDPDVDANQFFDSCVVDLCQVTNDSMWQDQLCEDIAAFVDKCTSENIAPGNWRNETKCIPDCGADELYSVMMTGCPETCDSPFPTACDEPKQEGCACREGYVRLNDACVPRQSAGCVFDGYTMCECKAYGDPHFITYDIARLDFMGIGRFVFSRASLDDRPECSFIAEVITAHYNSTRSTASNPLSYAKEIDITIGANKIEFLKNQVVKVNGVVQTLPTKIGAIELNTTIPSGVNETGDVFLHVEGCEIKVFYDGKTKVEILVDKNLYRGQLTGICGNCDGDKSNDYVTAAGIDVVTKIDRDKLVGESWRL